MRNFLYAAYELRSEKEMCIGVWDSVAELCGALDLSPAAAYRNLYQTGRGRKFSRTKVSVHRIPKD